MSQNEPLNIVDEEKNTITLTKENNQSEILLFDKVQDVFVSGFTIIQDFVYTDDTELIWLILLTRAFNSMRCSIDLMMKGYYSQSMVLLRTITEDWLICGAVKEYTKVRDRLLGDGKRLNYKELALRQDALSVYENDYDFQCKFAHSSKLSLRVMIDQEKTLKVVPSYDELLFFACTESLYRAFLNMSVVMLKLLNSINKSKAKEWSEKNINTRDFVINWLDNSQSKINNMKEMHK